MATKGWSFGALTDAIKGLAFWDPVDVYKAIYPVGICVMFADTTNPNTAFPGTKWLQITDAASIRAVVNASIGVTSGSDQFTLDVGSLPKHSHSWSGTVSNTDLGTKTTSSFDYGNKGTDAQGSHNHAFPYSSYSGDSNGGLSGGQRNNGNWTVDRSDTQGNHGHTVYIGPHDHTIYLGSHNHSVAGSVGDYGLSAPVTHTTKVRGYGVWRRSE